MVSATEYRRLLADFGRAIGLEGLAPDDAGYLCLQIGDAVLNIEFVAAHGHALTYAEAGQMPPQPQVEDYARICELNYAALMLGNGAVAVDTQSGRILLVDRIALTGLNARDLELRIQAIANQVEAVRSALLGADGRRRANEAEVPAYDGGGMGWRV